MESPVDLNCVDLPVSPGTTRADFYTAQNRVSADVITGDRRLVDLMRDTTRQYVEVRRLSVSPFNSTEPRGQSSDGLLNKAEIDWVAVHAEPSRAEGRLYGFVRKAPVRVRLALRCHYTEGSVFVDTATTDPVSFFLRTTEKNSDRFLAVTSSTVSSAAGTTDEVGLAIVNRSKVRSAPSARKRANNPEREQQHFEHQVN
jgi:hypothetical protein